MTLLRHSPRQEDVSHGLDLNPTIGCSTAVTWKEVIRKLKAAGFIEKRRGKGSHMLFVHPESGEEV